MKKYSTLLALRKMQIKNYNETVFHTHQIRQKFKISCDTKAWETLKKYPAVSLSHLYPREIGASALGRANQNKSSTTVSIKPEQETAKSTYGRQDEPWDSRTMAWYYKTLKEKSPPKNKINKERPNKRVDSIYASSKINKKQNMLFGIHT